MPRIKSAKKAMRQARTRFTHNRAQRSALRTALTARKDLIHRNNAARLKSRLAKFVKTKASS